MTNAPMNIASGALKAVGLAAAIWAVSLAAPQSAQAVPLTVTFDPSGAGLGGGITPFQSSTQNGLDTARAVIDNATGAFTEVGVLRFDKFNDPVTFAPLSSAVTGLGSTYGLYLTFTATGVLPGFNAAVPNAELTGTFTGITYSLIGDPGNGNTLTTGGLGASPVLNDVGSNDVVLATGGAILAKAVSINNLGIPSASVILTMTDAGTSFFLAPPGVNTFAASFTNSPGTFDFGAGPGNTTVLAISAGGFNNNFDKIPEPASLTLLGAGLLSLGLLSRRRKA